MSNSSSDKQRDEVLKRMLGTPPKKQVELKKELKERRGSKPASNKHD
jgi:hypothetical protein